MKLLQFIMFMFLCVSSLAQELPPIEQFTTSDYGGDNQNWMISQAANKFIYTANNKGLLEYNGSNWIIYPSPNNSILRAVKVIGDRIYTGCYEEFGYWKRDKFGKLNYTSLVTALDPITVSDDQIWNIVDYDEWVLFQSGHKLYFYNKTTEEFKIISSKNIIYKVFNIENQIYYHVANEGIYIIEDGESKLLTDNKLILDDRVINIFQYNQTLLVLTRNSGFYYFKNNQLISWNQSLNKSLEQFNVFSSIQLEDGSFVLGTISNGVLKINVNGKIDYSINQKNGLGNNTVLSLFEDNANNVWAGTDNGINCINLKSPISTFIDYEGVLGTVYTTMIFNNFFYVGTNQGLFYRPVDAKNEDFRFIQGTAGQVWELYNHNDDTLFCGHHLGTFIISGARAVNISPVLGAWNFKKIPERKNLLLQGNYDGLYVLQETEGTWEVRNKINGFSNSSRFFEINNANQVLVNHEYKGVYRLQLDSDFTKAIDVKTHSELKLGETSSLITYDDNILYTSKDGIFKYVTAKEVFEKDETLSALVAEKLYTSGRMITDETAKLWMFSENNISYIENDNLTNIPRITNLAISSKLRNGVLGFENLQIIETDKYALGTTNGYLILDLSKMKNESNYVIHLNAVSLTDINNVVQKLSVDEELSLSHKQGILSFGYSVPVYSKYMDVKYQYKLDGLIDRWSPWTQNTTVQFENLSFGDYTLLIRAKVGDKNSSNTIKYDFVVNRPWFISNLAILLYLIALVGIGLFIHKAYKFYYERILKHEQIKNERAIIQIKNEKLNQDIEGKNRELVISTMSIIKKNELLGKIKNELKSAMSKKDLGGAIELIDTNLNNNKDWTFFKQAFNNADKDFLDKIKVAHPDLTPNDLKFCAYLRLNLSSKEIAPLLNISIKSVETKRYRLRKRLHLQHDDSLVDYILKF